MALSIHQHVVRIRDMNDLQSFLIDPLAKKIVIQDIEGNILHLGTIRRVGVQRE